MLKITFSVKIIATKVYTFKYFSYLCIVKLRTVRHTAKTVRQDEIP